VQLALWITAHLCDHVDTLLPLTSAQNQPNIYLDSLPYALPATDERRTKGGATSSKDSTSKGKSKGTKGSKSSTGKPTQPGGPNLASQEKEGRIFKAHLRVVPPLIWPRLQQWPGSLSPSERQHFNNYTHNLINNPTLKVSDDIITQVFRIPPTPVSLALAIYEPDPLQSQLSKEGLDFAQHFLVLHHLSGPRRMRTNLLPEQVQQKLNEPLQQLNSDFLFKPTLSETLVQHLDNIFTPRTGFTSRPQQQRSRSRNPGNSDNTWETAQQQWSEPTETWQQSWWQPKDWSSSSTEWKK
jgi:hypothetical protein